MKSTTQRAAAESVLHTGATNSSAAAPVQALDGASHEAAAQAQGWHAPLADNDTDPEGLLSRAEFLRMVQREKRRTDRSHSALSLVVLDVDTGRSHALDEVLDCVAAIVRETDYLTVIDHRRIAVLLPDTGDAGLSSFLDKVALAHDDRSSSVVGATYPAVEFDRLVAERLGTPRSRNPVDADEHVPSRPHGYPLKRALDVIGAVFALVVLSPLMLLVSLLVKATSRGPVVFAQSRIGQGGKTFVMYKFRSMRTDVDDSAHREFVAKLIDGPKPADSSAPSSEFKMKADPRITPIGKFIRKTSIDELPQFFNVLKGDMSLVGPRPPVAYEAARYKSWHLRRVLDLKPGLTGIWQVEGRSRVSFDEMVRMDLRYLRRCSLWFDIGILLRTFLVVITCKGAQ